MTPPDQQPAGERNQPSHYLRVRGGDGTKPRMCEVNDRISVDLDSLGHVTGVAVLGGTVDAATLVTVLRWMRAPDEALMPPTCPGVPHRGHRDPEDVCPSLLSRAEWHRMKWEARRRTAAAEAAMAARGALFDAMLADYRRTRPDGMTDDERVEHSMSWVESMEIGYRQWLVSRGLGDV